MTPEEIETLESIIVCAEALMADDVVDDSLCETIITKARRLIDGLDLRA